MSRLAILVPLAITMAGAVWLALSARRTVARAVWRPIVALSIVALGAGLAWSAAILNRAASSEALLASVPGHEISGARFVESGACESCHPSEYATWHRSFHRTMTQLATPASVLGDFSVGELSSHGRTYRLERRGDEFWVNMVDPDWEQDYVDRGTDPTSLPNPPRIERRVVMTTGSHHMQTYWVASRRDGRLYNVPFVWLNADRRWAPREDVFLRPPEFPRQFGTWHNNCIECHSVAGESGMDPTTGTFDPQVAELGITCEACHSPGETHTRLNHSPLRRYLLHRAKAADPSIVLPERLSAAAATQVCGQCHGMNIFKADPRLPGERYRAGGDLTRTRMVLRTRGRNLTEAEREDWPRLQRHISRQAPTFLEERMWSDGMTRVSGREANSMMESACYGGGKLSCLSCHSMHDSDPDDQLAAGMAGDQACFQCHAEYRDNVEKHTHHAAGSSGSSCYNCHMPHTTYGLLKAIRSHLIDSPTVASSVETGRPNACVLCHLDKSLRWAADSLSAWYQQPAVALTAEQESVSAGVLWLLSGDAGQRALIAWHMGWEPARAASGSGWMAPYLGHLLDDPYSTVRYIAQRSLRSLPGFEKLDYDFIGPEEERQAAARRVLELWSQSGARAPERAEPRVLVDASGTLDQTLFARLAAARDDRPLDLRE